jgi:predicted transcriptional regulator
MKKLSDLTDGQLEILEVLWKHGEATANDIHDTLAKDEGLARGTVGTMLHRLARQGILGHRAEGREYFYRARVSREAVMAARLDGLVNRLFNGDLAAMVSFAVSKSDTRANDLVRLREMLDRHRARRK